MKKKIMSVAVLAIMLSTTLLSWITSANITLQWEKNLTNDWQSKQTVNWQYDTNQGEIKSNVVNDVKSGLSIEKMKQLLWCWVTQDCYVGNKFIYVIQKGNNSMPSTAPSQNSCETYTYKKYVIYNLEWDVIYNWTIDGKHCYLSRNYPAHYDMWQVDPTPIISSHNIWSKKIVIINWVWHGRGLLVIDDTPNTAFKRIYLGTSWWDNNGYILIKSTNNYIYGQDHIYNINTTYCDRNTTFISKTWNINLSNFSLINGIFLSRDTGTFTYEHWNTDTQEGFQQYLDDVRTNVYIYNDKGVYREYHPIYSSDNWRFNWTDSYCNYDYSHYPTIYCDGSYRYRSRYFHYSHRASMPSTISTLINEIKNHKDITVKQYKNARSIRITLSDGSKYTLWNSPYEYDISITKSSYSKEWYIYGLDGGMSFIGRWVRKTLNSIKVIIKHNLNY